MANLLTFHLTQIPVGDNYTCIHTSLTVALDDQSGPSTAEPKGKARDTKLFAGDQSLGNTVNFMRMTFWYKEFNASIAEGDIGRVFEILKV